MFDIFGDGRSAMPGWIGVAETQLAFGVPEIPKPLAVETAGAMRDLAIDPSFGGDRCNSMVAAGW